MNNFKVLFLGSVFIILAFNFSFADTLPVCTVGKLVAAPNEQVVFTPAPPSGKSGPFTYKFIGQATTTASGPVALAFIYPGTYSVVLQSISSTSGIYSVNCPSVTISLNATSTSAAGGVYLFPSHVTSASHLIHEELSYDTCLNLVQNLSYGYSDDVFYKENGVIYKLQKYLKFLGYLKADPTGYFGAMTKAAVKLLQADNDVEPTGFVGPITRASIKDLSCGTGKGLSPNLLPKPVVPVAAPVPVPVFIPAQVTAPASVPTGIHTEFVPAIPVPKPAPTPTVAPTPTSAPTSTLAPVTRSVSIQSFAFSSSALTVHKGDTIVWTNKDAAPHTVTGTNGGPSSGTLSQGGTYSFTFNSVGTFNYICNFHPSMTGKVTVID